MKTLRDAARKLALSGEDARVFLNGTFGVYAVRELDGLRFVADRASDAAQVVNLENFDPFASWAHDGSPIRKHVGRYGGPDRVFGLLAREESER